VYAQHCAACHGDRLEGNKEAGGDPLIGGRGSLTTAAPLHTVESYWPYATTLFDYIKRAMPFTAPGSLTDADTYSLVAFILSKARIIDPKQAIDARTLPRIAMPNRDGFVPDPRPEPSRPPSN
jgi:cytochrome c